MKNDLPNGFILKLCESCMLGMKEKLVSTHRTEVDAEAKSKSLGCSLSVFQILDIHGIRTLTAK